MLKNKNTILGALLIAILFLWATHLSDNQSKDLQEKAKIAQLAEKAKLDSLKSLKAEKTLAVPELIQASTPAVATVAPIMAGADSAKKDSVQLQQVAPRKVVVETDRFWITLDNQGAKIRSVVAKALQDRAGKFPELIQYPDSGALSLQLDEVDFDQQLFVVQGSLPDTIRVHNPLTVEFLWQNAQGQKLMRSYAFTQGGNKIHQVNRMFGFKPKMYTLHWKGGMRETDPIPEGFSLMGSSSYFFSEVILNNGYNVERNKVTEETWFNREEGKAEWVGLRRKYIAGVINWVGASEASIGAEPLKLKAPDPGTYRLKISDYALTDSIAYDFVVLPLVHSEIIAMNESYEKIMFSGWEWLGADKWFVALSGYILAFLNYLYQLMPNYGIAIILLTLAVKFATLPLTLKQLRSTRELQRHKPAIDEINLRNRANPAKKQAELMEYYKKNNVNPFGAVFGCLPMFLQMPVFISLFVVLGRAVELRYAPFAGWINDLSAPDVIFEALKIPVIFPEGLTILPFIMVITTYFQTKQTVTDPNQKMMIYLMPGMMFIFSSVMPSGLILYWIVSNLFSIIQFVIMNRKPMTLVQPAHEHMQNKSKKNQKTKF